MCLCASESACKVDVLPKAIHLLPGTEFGVAVIRVDRGFQLDNILYYKSACACIFTSNVHHKRHEREKIGIYWINRN